MGKGREQRSAPPVERTGVPGAHCCAMRGGSLASWEEQEGARGQEEKLVVS